MMFLSASCFYISLFFVAYVITVTENTSFLSQKLCNIHTVSPFNCTQKIKKIFLSKLKKYKFRKGKGYEKISQMKKPLEAARPLQQKSVAESGATFVTLVKWWSHFFPCALRRFHVSVLLLLLTSSTSILACLSTLPLARCLQQKVRPSSVSVVKTPHHAPCIMSPSHLCSLLHTLYLAFSLVSSFYISLTHSPPAHSLFFCASSYLLPLYLLATAMEQK